MRRKRIICAVALLLTLFIVSLNLSLGFLNVTELSLFSSVTPASSSTTVFVNPAKTLDETKQAGSFVTVNVDVSAVTDLYAWQVKLNWNKTLLRLDEIILGELLARSTATTSSEELGFVINSTDNTVGVSMHAESLLAAVGGVSESGTARLVSIRFAVLAYGYTRLNFDATDTILLNSTDPPGNSITAEKVNGFFSNRILGDAGYDKTVDDIDLFYLSKAFLSTGGPPPSSNWDEKCDFNWDNYVDDLDLYSLSVNFLRSIP